MTISVKLNGSHGKSFTSEVRYMFKLTLVPEEAKDVRGFHYIIMIDSSGSMDGMKINLAKEGAKSVIGKIPSGNKVTLVSFSSEVKVLVQAVEPSVARVTVDSIKADGPTPLYKSLKEAIEIHEREGIPSRIILLTDGKPTDKSDPEDYDKIKFPENTEVVTIGVGDDYNEVILKKVADLSNGLFYHLTDPSTIPEIMIKSAPTQVAGKNVRVEFLDTPSQVKLINYSGPPVTLSSLETVAQIFGELLLPPNFSGNVVRVKVGYDTPDGKARREIEGSLSVTPALNTSEFLESIDQVVVNEFRYIELLKEYNAEIERMDLDTATRTVKKLEELAEKTQRIEMRDTTKKLADVLEATKRIRTEETTKRIKKEVASEVTKKVRGG